MSTTNYIDTTNAIRGIYNSSTDSWTPLTGQSPASALSSASNNPNVKILLNNDGSIRNMTMKTTTSTNVVQNIGDSINSNLIGGTNSTVNNMSCNIPAETTVVDGEVVASSGLTGAGAFVCNTVVPAIGCVAGGMALGKKIDETLYNLNPNFWDSNGMQMVNPENWAEVTSNQDGLGADLFNFIMGIDDNGDTQAYLDEKALSQCALYMQQNGVFNVTSGYGILPDNEVTLAQNLFPTYENLRCYYSLYSDNYFFHNLKDNYRYSFYISSDYDTSNIKICTYVKWVSAWSRYSPTVYLVSSTPFRGTLYTYDTNNSTYLDDSTIRGTSLTDFLDGKSGYIARINILSGTTLSGEDHRMTDLSQISCTGSLYMQPSDTETTNPFNNNGTQIIGTLLHTSNTVLPAPTIQGITNQNDAKLPQLRNNMDVDDVLQALKAQYPELWTNAKTNNVIQPDGNVKQYTYVPVPYPDIKNRTDTKPTSSTSTQSKPKINPETDPDLSQKVPTITTNTPTTNPEDTGNGGSPIIPTPTSDVNQLFRIYNPTSTQLEDFGQWLWSTNFIDQLLKMFNNPMEAIIGLHKVYCTPSTYNDNNGTISVGYLDSLVSSKVVNNQYTTIDCGNVDMQEYFGSILDYGNFTKIHLFLPFVGIVELNNSDVMRSTINIVYKIDVLSGTTLVEVRIKRDSYNNILYTYTGNCAVQYPLSSGSYMGMVSGAISLAGGIAGTIASGGALAPMLMGSASSVLNMHTNVSHSGSISSNAGAMGGKIPYLIISRPQQDMPTNYKQIEGARSVKNVLINSCTGYVKVKDIIITDVHATQNELTEIENILKDGIII